MYRIGNKEVEAVEKVIMSKNFWRYSQNSEAKQFERELEDEISVKHALVMSSGTASLLCGLVALGIGPGDEVIVPGYTFISTALVPMALGAIPVIAEVDETLTIDPEDIKKKITPRTRVIMPVHINGLPCNMKAILEIAKQHGLYVLEDACQAVGGSYQGKRLGTLGDAGAFSFNYYKTISCGEGGALISNNTTTYEKARIYHDAGCAFFSPDQKVKVPYFAGVNYRMSDILSSIMRIQLGRLDGILKDLRQRKNFLIENLCIPMGWKLSPVNDEDGDCSIKLGIMFESNQEVTHWIDKVNTLEPGLKTECPLYSDRHVYINWEAVLEKRSIFNDCKQLPFTDTGLNYSKDMCPKTLDYLARTMYFLINPDMEIAELDRICKNIKDSY